MVRQNKNYSTPNKHASPLNFLSMKLDMIVPVPGKKIFIMNKTMPHGFSTLTTDISQKFETSSVASST